MNEISALGAPGGLLSSLLHPLTSQALINHQIDWPFDQDLLLSRMVRNVSINYIAEMDQS